MRRLVTSRLIWIYIVCKDIRFWSVGIQTNLNEIHVYDLKGMDNKCNIKVKYW